MGKISGAELVVRCLEAHDVRYLFTVPGAATDPILDVLVDRGPEVILCRHENSAAFMAQAWGRITGKPGVCMATAGPGLTNFVTAIATADAERCPLFAITGQVARSLRFKRAHQNIDAVNLFRPTTKWSEAAHTTDTLPDLIANAMRLAAAPREGATHLSIPVDLLTEKSGASPIPPTESDHLGIVDKAIVQQAARLLDNAKKPVVLLGIAASKPATTAAVRALLAKHQLPVVATFEAAGTISRDLVDLFMGRLGVFPNQPGDKVLAEADAILAIGFDLVEYDPAIWNKKGERPIIHIDETPATLDQYYQPELEFIGDIAGHLQALSEELETRERPLSKTAKAVRQTLLKRHEEAALVNTTPIHPRRLIYELRNLLGDDVTVISDVGSHQYWMARNFYSFEPQRFLTSMGFQSMGVSIPWAIAASLARPGEKVVSISGDGSFLMCSMELETAVRLNCPIVHLVWEDGAYDLVKIQQEQKYGRPSASTFGLIDTVKYAQAMGATGMRITTPDTIRPILKKALKTDGPVVISIPIDYSDNREIVEVLRST